MNIDRADKAQRIADEAMSRIRKAVPQLPAGDTPLWVVLLAMHVNDAIEAGNRSETVAARWMRS